MQRIAVDERSDWKSQADALGFNFHTMYPLPVFEGKHVVIGSWLVASQPNGLCIREDDGPITKDSSRFLPHVIYD